jgi:hypothetical protein
METNLLSIINDICSSGNPYLKLVQNAKEHNIFQTILTRLGDSRRVTKTDLYDAYLCKKIENAVRNSVGNSKQDYLDFTLDLIREMSKDGKFSISTADPQLETRFSRFFGSDTKTANLRKGAPIVIRDGHWEWESDTMRAHVQCITQTLGRDYDVLELLNDGIFV